MEGYSTEFEEHNESSWSFTSSVIYYFENYGWYLFIAFISLIFIYYKTLKSYIERYKEYRFEREYAAKYHKNPDVFAAHVNAQQQWAEKMQEKYNREAEEQLRKMKEREEKKRQQLAEKYGDSSSGHVLGGSSDTTTRNDKQNNLRPDYNPLMGSASSSTYRPPRRSPCGGGGCGR